MDNGFVSCSKLKYNLPAPAGLLYSRSPTFTNLYIRAKSENISVYIVSAKYGVISPNTIIPPYDLYLGDMSPQEIQTLQAKCARQISQISGTNKSYMSKKYNQCFPSTFFDEMINESMFDREGTKPARREWGLWWLVEYIYKHPGTSQTTLKYLLKEKGYADSTTQSQMYKIKNSPFIQIKNDQYYYRFGA